MTIIRLVAIDVGNILLDQEETLNREIVFWLVL